MSHESFMGEEVLWMFQGCFKSFSKKSQENVQSVLKKVSCCMALIAASGAEEGLVLNSIHSMKTEETSSLKLFDRVEKAGLATAS